MVAALSAYTTELQLNRPVRRVLPPVPVVPGERGRRDGTTSTSTSDNDGGAGRTSTPEPPSSDLRQTDPPVFDPRPALEDMPVFVRGRQQSKTHGRWVDAHGTVHKLLSGEHDGQHAAVTLRAIDLGLIPSRGRLARAGDVELKFALGMRQRWEKTQTVSHETIVINNPKGPCPGPLGCDGLLSRYLPPGATLTVWWPGDNSPHKTYRGVPDQ